MWGRRCHLPVRLLRRLHQHGEEPGQGGLTRGWPWPCCCCGFVLACPWGWGPCFGQVLPGVTPSPGKAEKGCKGHCQGVSGQVCPRPWQPPPSPGSVPPCTPCFPAEPQFGPLPCVSSTQKAEAVWGPHRPPCTRSLPPRKARLPWLLHCGQKNLHHAASPRADGLGTAWSSCATPSWSLAVSFGHAP